jgi:hypothetical protein
MKALDVPNATTADLIAFYNEHSGAAPVKKFQDRATAERRVLALLSGKPAKPAPEPVPLALPEPKSKPITGFKAPEPRKGPAKTKKTAPEAPRKAPEAVRAAKAGKAPKKPAKAPRKRSEGELSALLSDAQIKLWKVPEVRATRCERSAVAVDDEEYRSVPAAFEALSLPMGEMCRFRTRLKEEGKLTEYAVKWAIIPLNY